MWSTITHGGDFSCRRYWECATNWRQSASGWSSNVSFPPPTSTARRTVKVDAWWKLISGIGTADAKLIEVQSYPAEGPGTCSAYSWWMLRVVEDGDWWSCRRDSVGDGSDSVMVMVLVVQMVVPLTLMGMVTPLSWWCQPWCTERQQCSAHTSSAVNHNLVYTAIMNSNGGCGWCLVNVNSFQQRRMCLPITIRQTHRSSQGILCGRPICPWRLKRLRLPGRSIPCSCARAVLQ